MKSRHLGPLYLFYTYLFFQIAYASPLFPHVKDEWKAFYPKITPKITNTTLAHRAHYRSLAAYAGMTRYLRYCRTTVGQRVGKDATLLWQRGNGINVQYAHISHSPTLGIIIAFEGTNASSYASIAMMLGHRLEPPVPELEWLGNVQLANSVQSSWMLTASLVKEQLLKAIATYPEAKIIVTGHSFGAAIGLLSALSLTHELQRSIEAVFFGMPRVEDQQFANAVDRILPHQKHLVNHRDPVPHLPTWASEFRHPSGEVFMADKSGKVMYDCEGQESVRCSFGIFLYNFYDHLMIGYGDPYNCPVSGPTKESSSTSTSMSLSIGTLMRAIMYISIF